MTEGPQNTVHDHLFKDDSEKNTPISENQRPEGCYNDNQLQSQDPKKEQIIDNEGDEKP